MTTFPCLLYKTIYWQHFLLTHIINLSIIYGIVPDELKIARVLPIFKSGDKALFSN